MNASNFGSEKTDSVKQSLFFGYTTSQRLLSIGSRFQSLGLESGKYWSAINCSGLALKHSLKHFALRSDDVSVSSPDSV